jgi:1-acyl-sn-glycerol-3-phosphate acyltransferase
MSMMVRLAQSTCVLLVRLITGANALWIDGSNHPNHRSPAARVYFANHGSHLDFVAIWAALPRDLRNRTRPVAALDYWGGGALRRWIATQLFRSVLIDRKKVTRENNPIELMKSVLESGESLILFPEGTRSATGELGEFKSGLFHLARQCPRIEFVPVLLQNLNRVLPRGEVLPIPILTTIAFGRPLLLGEEETRDAFLARARGAIVELQPDHAQPEAKSVLS